MATKEGQLRRLNTQHVIIVFIKNYKIDSTVIKVGFVAETKYIRTLYLKLYIQLNTLTIKGLDNITKRHMPYQKQSGNVLQYMQTLPRHNMLFQWWAQSNLKQMNARMVQIFDRTDKIFNLLHFDHDLLNVDQHFFSS